MGDDMTRILLLEDNLSDVAMALASLPEPKFDVTVVTTLAEAVETLRKVSQDFDLGLVDLGLSDARGLDCPRRLLAHPNAPPLVVMTGHVDDDLVRDSLRLGVEDVFDKASLTVPGAIERTVLRAAERAAARAAQRRYTRSMQARNRSLRRGMERLAHDLRNPMVAVRGYAQTLRRDDLDPQVRRHIHEDLVGLADRTIELLDAIQMDQELDGIRQQIDLGELARWAWEVLAPEFPDADAALAVEPIPTIWGHVEPLRHMVLTLLDNALRHREPDRPLHVRVHAELSSEGERIVVSDDGPGVPHDALATLFDVGAITSPDGRSSLGLASVRATMGRHDGESHARLNDAGGLDVVLTFPRRGPNVPGTLRAR